MVSTAARHYFPHKIGLYVAFCFTLIMDAFAITYVVQSRKKCRKNLRQTQSKTDLGWMLVGLAVADIILAIVICGLTEYTRFC